MRIPTILALISIVEVGCAGILSASENLAETATAEVLLASEVQWEQLNPARGDMSPEAGTLWGDRRGAVPTGFLAKFVDGFSSPPHIHNATYRAVVISGLIHNDDPKAAHMWMPAGSFWTQPKGELHITAAKGKTNLALVEIDKGPYLVLPPDKAFDSGERPINVDSSNIVWVNPPGMRPSTDGPKLAYLWGGATRGAVERNLRETSGRILRENTKLRFCLPCCGYKRTSSVSRKQLPDIEAGKLFQFQGRDGSSDFIRSRERKYHLCADEW